MTIREIAKIAGVSPSTVSKALNDSYRDISEDTRKRIKLIVEEHKYVPHSGSSVASVRKTKNIALFIPNVINPFFSEVAQGVTDYAYSSGINAILCNTDDDLNRENRHLASLANGMVDGFIITPTEDRREGYDGILPHNMPLVLLGCSIWMERCYNTVRTDSSYGAFLAVEHLIKMGHRDILYIGGRTHSMIHRLRLEGYVAALGKHNIELDERKVYEHKYHNDWESWAINDAIHNNVPFTAVFCVNDIIAHEVLRALKRRSLKVPEDVSVVGFDDLSMTNDFIGLTSVRQPKYELGYNAAKNLITLIEGGQVGDILLKPELKERSSVKRI